MNEGGGDLRTVEHNSVIAASNISATEALAATVLTGERFIALTGEPGVRRSSIVDALVIVLADAGIRVVRVRNSTPGPLRLDRLVVLILGGQQTQGLEDGLQRVLRGLTDPVHRGKRLVLVIEGADELDRPALEMLTLLPDVRREGSPRVQIVLVGRTGFWTLLADHSRASLGVLATAVEPTPLPARGLKEPNLDRGIRLDEPLAPLSSLRTCGPSGRLLPEERGRRSGLALCVIASGMAAAIGVVALGPADRKFFPVRPAALRQEASMPTPAEPSAPTPVGSMTGISSTDASGVGSTPIRMSGMNHVPPTSADQQAVGSVSPPSAVGSATAPGPTARTPPTPAGVDVLRADTNRAQRASSAMLLGSKSSGRSQYVERSEARSIMYPNGQGRRQQDVGQLPGASSRERPVVSTELIFFHGPVNNETMHRAGQLSLILRSQGPSGPIRARFDAGEGLLGSGELEGSLSENGRISVSGQLMMGKNAFICDLSGLISGDKLTGSANFVRTRGGPVAHSRFTLTRS